jgi:hypothetical protein
MTSNVLQFTLRAQSEYRDKDLVFCLTIEPFAGSYASDFAIDLPGISPEVDQCLGRL